MKSGMPIYQIYKLGAVFCSGVQTAGRDMMQKKNARERAGSLSEFLQFDMQNFGLALQIVSSGLLVDGRGTHQAHCRFIWFIFFLWLLCAMPMLSSTSDVAMTP